jgi:hypothetical protein
VYVCELLKTASYSAGLDSLPGKSVWYLLRRKFFFFSEQVSVLVLRSSLSVITGLLFMHILVLSGIEL